MFIYMILTQIEIFCHFYIVPTCVLFFTSNCDYGFCSVIQIKFKDLFNTSF